MPTTSLRRAPALNSEFAEALSAFLKSHRGETITLLAVSRSLGLTPYETARRFRRLTGQSFHRRLGVDATSRTVCETCATVATLQPSSIRGSSEIAPA